MTASLTHLPRNRQSDALTLRSYLKAVRRSVYDAEAATRSKTRSRLVLLLEKAAQALSQRLHFAKPVLRPLAILFWQLVHVTRLMAQAAVKFIRPLGRLILSTAFANRCGIRRLVRWIMPVDADFTSVRHGSGLAALSYRLIERRIPVISSLTRRLLYLMLATMLSAQMAAGHIGNTLLLARLINLAFRPYIRARRLPVSFLYFNALFHCRQYHRIIAEISTDETIEHHYLNHILGVAHLYSDRPARARYYFERAIVLNDRHAPDHRMLGRAWLLLDNENEAARSFRVSVELEPNTVMAHQNYAGRYDIPNYKPQEWELREAGRLLIYDNYGQLAEDFFLLGKFEASFRLYQSMFDCQARLRTPLPHDLVQRLAALDSKFDIGKPVRILPYEWVTQFGHIGLLDSYIKMARLGMYPDANHVLLAPQGKVSNSEYLGYWDDYFTIVRDRDLVDALFPYQRMIGDNFMAYPGDNGVAEPWTRAAARAHIGWACREHQPLLQVGAEHLALGARALAALGVPDGAWYVGLHVREGGYYGESSRGMSIHRNASIEDYLPAIRAVTDRGGYVIRLGDSTMKPLRAMERVIDYALSAEKSPGADIFFCGTSRFVIGTTSGLTTACISFGTPMVLVNCISNDWQLWSDATDFIVKPVWDTRNKQLLPFAEVCAPPVQGYLINAQVMRRHGLEAVPNTPQEIADAVTYKLDLMDGAMPQPDFATEPLRTYRAAMRGNDVMFGAARPVPAFLERHRSLLKPPVQQAVVRQPVVARTR